MFFAILIFIIWAILSLGMTPDTFGWLMIVGAGWVFGYLDSRFHKKSDTDIERTLPDEDLPETDDDLFQK